MTLPILILSLLAPSPPPFTATEMMRLQRLADPQVSPDGKWIAYQSTQVDTSAWTRNADLWVVPAAGGPPRRLTDDPKSDTRPRWSPDGRRIAFLSTRDGGSQVWVAEAAGGTARKVTSLPTEAGGVLWVDERTLLVTSDVYPDCGPAAAGGAYDAGCNRKRLESAARPSLARAYDRLLYRHWSAWEDLRRSHLHVVDVASGDARDLTPGEADVPPFSVGGPGRLRRGAGRQGGGLRPQGPGDGRASPPTASSTSCPSPAASPRRCRAAPATTASRATARTEPISPSAPRCARGTRPTAGG